MADRLKILLIEDDPAYVRLIREILLAEPEPCFEVDCTECLAAGMARLARHVYDLVLLDLALPDSSGLTTLQQLTSQGAAVPVVVLLERPDRCTALQAIREGAQDYLVKGEDRFAFLRAIQHARERFAREREFRRLDEEMQRRLQERAAQLESANRDWRAEMQQAEVEERLRAERNLLRTLIDNLPDYIFVKDRESRFLLNNQAHLGVLGAASQEEVRGKTDFDFFPKDLAQGYYADEQQLVQTGQPLHSRLEQTIHPQEGWQWVETTKVPLRGLGGKVVGLVGIARNVTLRKQIEDQLRQSEARYRALVEQIPATTYLVALREGRSAIYLSPHFEALLGISHAACLANANLWYERIHPEDRERVLTTSRQALRTKSRPIQQEYRLQARDGSTIWVHDQASVITNAAGQVEFLHGVVLDITARKRSEQLLRESESRWRQLVQTSPDIILSLDHNGTILFINRTHPGYPPVEKVIGTRVYDWLPPEHQEPYRQVLTQVFLTGQPSTYDVASVAPDGTRTWWTTHLGPVVVNGQVQTVTCVAKDVTERRRMEEDLRQARDQLEQQVRARTADLEQALAELRQSETRKRAMLDASLDAIVSINQKGNILEWNPAAERIFGYTQAQVLGKPLADLVIPPHLRELHRQGLARYLVTGQGPVLGRRLETTALRADGSTFLVEIAISPVFVENTVIFTGFIRDITERKRAEEQLRATLRERETLLKEVHHRVKNNLAVIDGLFYFQLNRAKNPPIAEIFRESRNRIRSMAAVHESLYRAQDLAHVDFAQYLERLCHNLFSSYGADQTRIELQLDLQPVKLSLDAAVPLGLLCNELLSNALKHAFPASRRGYVRVELRQDPPDRVCLTVADNGIGLPPDLDPGQVQTLGLELVHLLAEQLEAAVDLKREAGTSFTICFTPASAREEVHV